MFGSIDIKTRPLKLLFLIKPNDKKALREAMRINSSIWGGVYNPIIPLYFRTPDAWKEKGLKTKPVNFFIKGYLTAFDPDIIVNMTKKDLPQYIIEKCPLIITENEVWGDIHNKQEFDYVPQYGIGVFEIFKSIYKKHFNYKERCPHKVVLPKYPKTNNLFWVSFFGEFPRDIFKIIKKETDYYNAFDIEEYDVTQGFNNLFKSDNITPLRAIKNKLEGHGGRKFRSEKYVFFMDAGNILDVIDYWNLRALGKIVLPMPIQFKDDETYKEEVKKFLKEFRGPMRYNEKIWDCASFVRSRNTKMKDMQEYAQSLGLRNEDDKNNDKPYYSLQHWYPRIWDDWARNHDGATPVEYSSSKEGVDIDEAKGDVNISRPLVPDFIFKHTFRKFICANVINTSIYRDEELFAQAFPVDAGKNVLKTISEFGSWKNEWRISNRGIVKLIDSYHSLRWKLPKAQDVFFSWLKDLGWEPTLSTPGKIANKMYKQLEGWVYVLKDKGLIDFFEQINRDKYKNKGMPVGEVMSKINKLKAGDNILKRLMEISVFKLGITAQCPECSKKSWHNLDSLKEKIICSKCLEEFVSIGNIEQSQWAYKTTGPFSIPGYADGSYSVLLSLNLIMNDIHSHNFLTTPVFSFNARKNNIEIEADFAILYKDSGIKGENNGVIFGECKTFGNFEKKDFERMKIIAENFPGAILLFSTLKNKLTTKEKKQITKIAQKGRKYWKNDLPINPVMILTGNEIFNQFGPPTCWNELSKEKRDYDFYSIVELCNQTQRIYLDLPRWEEDWHKEWEGRRSVRNIKKLRVKTNL